ncbi:MAG TPA: L,D-transpeptidase [Solirubrobacteraceae bacterium]|jgi:peptidoglycan hydrolase-like protein with peptidoglycan-binding domain|nr:L,D-transpeptidase [Solirubrobacteraceae bacterium]
MHVPLRTLAGACASSLALIAAPVAGAETTSSTPAPAVTPAAAGKLTLSLVRVGGSPPFSTVGRRVTIRGIVTPYVAGQTVKVSFYRDGKKVSVQARAVAALGTGSGAFTASYASPLPGLVQARVAHYATPLQAQFTGRAPAVRYVQVNLGPGASGPSVRLLQSELDVLHYAVPLSGVLDEGTGRALIAYRKMNGLERVPYAGRQVFALLARHAGSFQVLYRRDGRHVEADLTKQVLAEIEPGGRVHAIYTMSSGKPSTPTVIGSFRVYLKTPGVNTEGMVDSNYFIRGYAIHGYAEVPTYAASHGCLRVPIPDAAAIFAWVQQGTPVDVYNEGGGGSGRVRSNAGP